MNPWTYAHRRPRRLALSAPLALSALVALACAGALRAEELVDPTQPHNWAKVIVPGNVVVQQAPTFTLESILFSPSRRLAVINGRTLGEGETLGKLQLLKVDRRQVTVRIDGQRQVLLLKPISDVRR